ncbi:hypothetical protein HPB49_009007 [Dermacentor silvarum]|uniref:Uncharacterized protein n=1 Tax=Dermacentor silvarum TaxID=543639 RepID=A0ACB8DY88_DERSI|nr:sex-determining region Y protein [Dermacentor silvarum]KAH7979306.1 hypothetical protein HPB49_009007 [Dermacentor silvarum]
MLFAQEKRRWVAAENANENNQRVSSRLGKLWRTLGAADKGPYQRKAAEAAAVHRRKYLDYLYNPPKARRRKEPERSTKKFAGKTKNDSSGNQEQQPSPSTAATHGRSTPEFQQQRDRSGAIAAAAKEQTLSFLGWHLGHRSENTGPYTQVTTVPAPASDHSAAWPYNVHRFHGPLPPSPRRANRGSAAKFEAARAFGQSKGHTPNGCK